MRTLEARIGALMALEKLEGWLVPAVGVRFPQPPQ